MFAECLRRRARLKGLHPTQIDPLALVEGSTAEDADVPPGPDAPTQTQRRIAQLLAKLTQCGCVIGLAGLDAAAGRAPPGPIAVPETDEQDSIGLIEQEDPNRLSAGQATRH